MKNFFGDNGKNILYIWGIKPNIMKLQKEHLERIEELLEEIKEMLEEEFNKEEEFEFDFDEEEENENENEDENEDEDEDEEDFDEEGLVDYEITIVKYK
jgi:hypothetical protein